MEMQNATPSSFILSDTVLWLFGLLVGIVLALLKLIYNIMNNKIKEVQVNQADFAGGIWKEVNDIKKDTDQIRYNYLDRFAEVKQIINDGNKEILEKLNDFMQGVAKKD